MTRLITRTVLSFHILWSDVKGSTCNEGSDQNLARLLCANASSSTCLNVSVLNFNLQLFVRDSGTKNRMKTTSARAIKVATMTTMVSLPVSISMPAPIAGDIIREAANPAVTAPHPRLLLDSSVTSEM